MWPKWLTWSGHLPKDGIKKKVSDLLQQWTYLEPSVTRSLVLWTKQPEEREWSDHTERTGHEEWGVWAWVRWDGVFYSHHLSLRSHYIPYMPRDEMNLLINPLAKNQANIAELSVCHLPTKGLCSCQTLPGPALAHIRITSVCLFVCLFVKYNGTQSTSETLT